MFEEISRLFLEDEIDRRTFIKRITRLGVSAAGASAVADALAQGQDGEDSNGGAVPEVGRVLKNMTGGELVAEFLIDWDIPYMFGLAGSEETGLLDAIPDRPDIQYMTCLHEHAAMAMADGFSRSTGKTSFVQLHSVAGTAYAMGQLATSFRDRIPVVVAAGRQSTTFRGHAGFLESVNLHEMPRDYTQWTWDVMSTQTIPEVLRRAFLLAEAPPGGPSFVTFSKDLFEQRVPAAEIIPRSRSRVSYEVAPNTEQVRRIADNLLRANRPCLFVGNECIRHEISTEVAEIAELTGSMVMNSVKIPVVFPNTHPNFVGEIRTDDPELIGQVDTFWSLGGHMFKLFNLPPEPLLNRSAVVMHTSMVSDDVGRNYPVDVATLSSLKSTTRMVLDELRSRDIDAADVREKQQWVESYTSTLRENYARQADAEWDSNPISTSRLMVELNRVIADDAYMCNELITSDTHPRKFLDFDHTKPPEQRRREFYTTGGILGWGVPSSIGTKIGNPDKEVWCLTGDGCFNFGSQSLWSAARYEVPIGVVIFNNGQYQANRINQRVHGGRIAETGKYIGVSLEHPDIDYAKMCGAYGIEGERVIEPDSLATALQRCKASMVAGRPYLVDVKIAREGPGAESDWYDFYSVAKGITHQS